jgi:hypothetical protein
MAKEGEDGWWLLPRPAASRVLPQCLAIVALELPSAPAAAGGPRKARWLGEVAYQQLKARKFKQPLLLVSLAGLRSLCLFFCRSH